MEMPAGAAAGPGAGLCDCPNAMPAAAAPPTSAPITSHLVLLLCDALKTPSLPACVAACGAAVSFRYWVLMIPARAWSLTAVMRISIGPGVLFHCMPSMDACPSAPVFAISVRRPVLKQAAGARIGKTETHRGIGHRLAGFVGHQHGQPPRGARPGAVDHAFAFDHFELDDDRGVRRDRPEKRAAQQPAPASYS